VVIDMTPDGRFARPPGSPFAEQVLRIAVLVALITGALALAALVLWAALVLIPVALGAALVAYAAFRWRVWRARRDLFGGGGRDLYRP
jgi:hypothetical protein